jgi:hypothetical protein
VVSVVATGMRLLGGQSLNPEALPQGADHQAEIASVATSRLICALSAADIEDEGGVKAFLALGIEGRSNCLGTGSY